MIRGLSASRLGTLPWIGVLSTEVTYNGDGTSETTLPRIFEPFITHKQSGRGLGLCATLGIVRTHKGSIQVTSKLGAGTAVAMLLP